MCDAQNKILSILIYNAGSHKRSLKKSNKGQFMALYQSMKSLILGLNLNNKCILRGWDRRNTTDQRLQA